jgi:hypothetical protein
MAIVSSHRRIDERSLALHRAVAEKLRAHPELPEIARENLARWSRTAGRSLPYLEEWQRILDGPADELLERIGREGEYMTALRQSSPFAGVLSPAERWAIYERFERKRETT